jgi:hypothetical protein
MVTMTPNPAFERARRQAPSTLRLLWRRTAQLGRLTNTIQETWGTES